MLKSKKIIQLIEILISYSQKNRMMGVGWLSSRIEGDTEKNKICKLCQWWEQRVSNGPGCA